MSMLLDSNSYLDVLPYIWEFSGQSICDFISAWYTNALSQGCRGMSYNFIWYRKKLWNCWIYRPELFWNDEWGSVCDAFITYYSYSTFFHLVLLAIYHSFYEFRCSGTPAPIKYCNNNVWAYLLCVKGYIMMSPKHVTYTFVTLFPDLDIMPYVMVSMYVVPLNRGVWTLPVSSETDLVGVLLHPEHNSEWWP